HVASAARHVRIDVAFEAEPRGGKREHAAELAAAENADGRSGRERGHSPLVTRFLGHSLLGSSFTDAVCLARCASRRAARSVLESARICAARSPAFVAPA